MSLSDHECRCHKRTYWFVPAAGMLDWKGDPGTVIYRDEPQPQPIQVWEPLPLTHSQPDEGNVE